MKRQKSYFRLKGLSRLKSMTCYPLTNENIFWPKVGIEQDRFNTLWEYMEDDWANINMLVEIEHDGLYDDGTPINPVVVGTKELEPK